MFRRVFAWSLVFLLLGGCKPAPKTEPPVLTEEVALHEGEGYRLTYPALFTLSRKTEEALYFTAEGATIAFSLTREENPYGLLPIEEYPAKMGVYDGVTAVNDHAFAVEKHIPDMLSGYFLYTFDEEYIYLLEYNYGGSDEEKKLATLFRVETK